MQIRQATLVPLILFLMLAAAGCGGDDDGGDGGGSSDAASADGQAADNQLGRTCSTSDPCPTSHQCVYLSSGNPDLGYCSPQCTTEQDCLDGYDGPSTGTVTCFVPNQPNLCSIACDTVADCPGELACVETGGPVKVCTTE